MKYKGQFKRTNDDTIQVDIITGGLTTPVVDLTFAGESPIIINQTSNDGLFTPIKSRGCTITVVTQDEYWNMYSASSHGTKVTVTNVTRDNDVLFNGYLTPCEYNQPLIYLNEIELEAVDTVSTLHDYKYTYINGNESQLVSIKKIIKHILVDIAGIEGGIYMPKLGLMMKKAWDSSCYPTEMEFLSEDVFFDDDGEAMTCYEVLEEICKFYNFTLVPRGNDVYFVDYEYVAKYNIPCAEWQQEDDNYLPFKNIRTDYIAQVYIPHTININSYAGDEQNIEIDNVYNKVEIKVETEDIDDDDVAVDPIDDMGTSNFYMYSTLQHHRSDGTDYTFCTRIFEYNGPEDSRWQCLSNTNAQFTLGGYNFLDNFTEVHYSQAEAYLDFPYHSSEYLFNQIVGQTCLPAQQISFTANKVPYYPNWNNYLLFFPQIEWLSEYYKRNPTTYTSDMWTLAYWQGMYEDHLGGSCPVLRYIGDKDIQYSPSDSSTVNYLCFTGDLLWQRNGNIGGVNYVFWKADEANHLYSGSLANIPDLGGQSTDASTRTSSNPNYRKGWDMLKIRLKIGNKYWNGTQWTTTPSTAWIPYHKEDVEVDNETLIIGGWNKPVCNHYYPTLINKDAYVIPINYYTGLSGKIVFEVFMPRIPYYNGTVTSDSNNKVKIQYEYTPPCIFMKNISLSLVSAPNTNVYNWYKVMDDLNKNRGDEDDEIKYSNVINTNNVKDFSDLTLKINTFNKKHPLSKSYIVEPTEYTGTPSNITSVSKCVYHTEGFYNAHSDSTQRQEMNIVDRYVDHHTDPKRIYNCVVHNYFDPYTVFDSSIFGNSRFVLDEQEYDVKNNVNTMKLIEF